MCTAISYCCGEHYYFGRTLDVERSYGEQVAVTPRHYPFALRCMPPVTSHYALAGIAAVVQGMPLYFDAINEKGLGMAGLNFPCSACYYPPHQEKANIAPFELIPWVLGQCANAAQAKDLLQNTNVANIPFSPQLPLTPLHWLIADAHTAFVLETTADGPHIYDDPAGVLTNEPPLPMQLMNLNNYQGLHTGEARNTFAPALPLTTYSHGMGAIGLPGDFSSPSRFVKAAFVRANLAPAAQEPQQVSQFFHMLDAVAMPRGCVDLGEAHEYTLYSSCCNAARGIYYYRTYTGCAICAVDMHREDLDGTQPVVYPLLHEMQVHTQN